MPSSIRAPLTLLTLLVLLLASRASWARAPEPGDRVRITLHDGNEVEGDLLGLTASGYRLSFGGTEIEVAYPSVSRIEVVIEDVLLEEMRPDGMGPDPRGRNEPHFAEPPAATSPPRAPTTSPPQEAEPEPWVHPEPAPSPRTGVPPPVATPPRAERRPDQSTRLEIPEKPRSRGGGLMATGFIMLGLGVATAASSAVLYDLDYEEDGVIDEPYLPAGMVAGSILATAGLALGVTGIIMKSVSGARRRRWERRYGDMATLRSGDVTVVPTFSAGGNGGLALVGAF